MWFANVWFANVWFANVWFANVWFANVWFANVQKSCIQDLGYMTFAQYTIGKPHMPMHEPTLHRPPGQE